MFEKFTEGSIKVIMLSQEEARRLGLGFVGTEQLLLGVIGQRRGIGARALQKLDVNLRDTRKTIELYIGRGAGFVNAEIPFTPRAKRVLEMSVLESRDLGQNYVGTEHILLALIAEVDGIALRTLERLGVDPEQLKDIIYSYIEETHDEIVRPLSKTEKYLMRKQQKGSTTPTLDEFSENMSREALEGKLDPVIGRDKEIEDLIAVLARRSKNNPVLMGEPGVGKTAVAEGLAQLIIDNNVPDFLEGSLIIALDLGSILAGTKYRGEFEERLKRIIDEVQKDQAIIIVIDEIHTLVGAGAAEGAVDAANILKPALARGKFRCIGATTIDEYRKYIERDPALERRFQPIEVPEPDIKTTIEILRGLRLKFETHHNLEYENKAIEQSAILANKYIRDRFLPDKAIDVLDEAGARVRLENRNLPAGLKKLQKELHVFVRERDEAVKAKNYVLSSEILDRENELRTHLKIMKQSLEASDVRGITRKEIDKVLAQDIANVVGNWTGIPVNDISQDESKRLLKMEKILHERIIGQREAVSAVAGAIRRSRVGLRNPGRPIASFIFAGPTGVGKTELTKAVAQHLFFKEENMIRLDMSEYMEKHTVAKLIGSPPGYVGYNEGGQLTEAVRIKPYAVVLFDEVEKAHPDVFNLLLQILDDGRLSDSKGRLIDFTNTLIVMTTNLGAKVIEKEGGIKPKDDRKNHYGLNLVINDHLFGDWEPIQKPKQDQVIIDRVSLLVKEELKNFFRPEFLNRIDGIIVFNHLTKHDIWDISAIMIKQLADRLQEKGLTLIVTEPVRALLVEEGHDPLYGARPLRRTIMHYLEDTLAEQCLSTELKPGTKLIIRRKTFKDVKEELKKVKSLDEIRTILQNTIVRTSDDRYELKLIAHKYFDYDNISGAHMNNSINKDSIDEDFTVPLGKSDDETFTNDIIVDIDLSDTMEGIRARRMRRKTKSETATPVLTGNFWSEMGALAAPDSKSKGKLLTIQKAKEEEDEDMNDMSNSPSNDSNDKEDLNIKNDLENESEEKLGFVPIFNPQGKMITDRFGNPINIANGIPMNDEGDPIGVELTLRQEIQLRNAKFRLEHDGKSESEIRKEEREAREKDLMIFYYPRRKLMYDDTWRRVAFNKFTLIRCIVLWIILFIKLFLYCVLATFGILVWVFSFGKIELKLAKKIEFQPEKKNPEQVRHEIVGLLLFGKEKSAYERRKEIARKAKEREEIRKMGRVRRVLRIINIPIKLSLKPIKSIGKLLKLDSVYRKLKGKPKSDDPEKLPFVEIQRVQDIDDLVENEVEKAFGAMIDKDEDEDEDDFNDYKDSNDPS